ncbi:MAG: hypothetical protein KBI04_06185 [Paludibacteraceae bacterium]|nr:hypothetical protein [Paludibacteraceae bacterium]
MKNKKIFLLIASISLLAAVLIYLINNTSQSQLIGSIICLTAILLTDIYYFGLFFNKSNFYIPSSQDSVRWKKWTLLALSCANVLYIIALLDTIYSQSYNFGAHQIVLLLLIAVTGIHTFIHYKLNPYGGIVIGKYKIYVISKGGRINSVSYDAIKACVVNAKEIAILTNKNKSLYVEINSNTNADLIKEKLSTKIDIKIV